MRVDGFGNVWQCLGVCQASFLVDDSSDVVDVGGYMLLAQDNTMKVVSAIGGGGKFLR